MGAFGGFDNVDYVQGGDGKPIPSGQEVAVTPIEYKEKTTDSGYTFHEYTFQVIDGPFKDKRIWQGFMWQSPEDITDMNGEVTQMSEKTAKSRGFLLNFLKNCGWIMKEKATEEEMRALAVGKMKTITNDFSFSDIVGRSTITATTAIKKGTNGYNDSNQLKNFKPCNLPSPQLSTTRNTNPF